MGKKKTFYVPLLRKKKTVSMSIVDKSNWQGKTDLCWQDCFFIWLEADWAQEQFGVIHGSARQRRNSSVSPTPASRNLSLNKVNEIITLMETDLKFENHLTATIICMGLVLLFSCLHFLLKCWCIFKISLLFRLTIELYYKVNEI